MADPLLVELLADAKLAHLSPQLLGESLASLADRIDDDRACHTGETAHPKNRTESAAPDGGCVCSLSVAPADACMGSIA